MRQNGEVEYDALLWLSFGGPEGPDEVMPGLIIGQFKDPEGHVIGLIDTTQDMSAQSS